MVRCIKNSYLFLVEDIYNWGLQLNVDFLYGKKTIIIIGLYHCIKQKFNRRV